MLLASTKKSNAKERHKMELKTEEKTDPALTEGRGAELVTNTVVQDS